MNYFTTRKLVYLSFLIALSIVLTRIMSLRIAIGGVEGIRIGFGGLPIIFAGVAFGPLAGAIVGTVSDLLGYFINPIGPYMPHFTLTSMLTGLLPGVIVFYCFQKREGFWPLLVAIALGQIISSVILVPIFLQQLFGLPLSVSLLPRIIGQSLHIPVYAYLCKTILNTASLKFSWSTIE